MDEYERGLKKGGMREFSRQLWGGVRNYMAEQIQCPGPWASQEVLESLSLSREHFRDEIGTKLNHLRGVQGK